VPKRKALASDRFFEIFLFGGARSERARTKIRQNIADYRTDLVHFNSPSALKAGFWDGSEEGFLDVGKEGAAARRGAKAHRVALEEAFCAEIGEDRIDF
jgi:hypothetical protein